MNSKRSYLDTLNAGRERRPQTTLEQISRSLETLEQRLGKAREETFGGRDTGEAAEPRYPKSQPYPPRAGEAPRAAAPSFAEPARTPSHDNPRPFPPQTRPSHSFEQGYQSIARDIDRVRNQEDGVAAVGKIAGELRGLREELRQQMTAGLHQEFEVLRKDIDNAFQSGLAGRGSAELGLEFERLSGAIQTLAEKSDDKGVTMLRLELEQVRSAIEVLAREESVQKVDHRWDDFYSRWNAFEDRVDEDSRKRADGPALSSLVDRLEQISSAVNNLPESLSLRSLEEKVRTLAGAVDQFANQQVNRGGEVLGMIDERLDEISRAIVASSVAAQSNTFDPAPLERVEQRIALLATQIEEVASSRPADEVIERLNLLSHRVDELAGRAHLPQEAMDHLAGQIAGIADRMERAPALPDADQIFQGIEQRFDLLSSMIERRQGDALEQGNMLFRDMERRLDEVADRLDRREPATVDTAGIMQAIDARFTALAKRLDTPTSDLAGHEAIRGLESRLDDISSRLDLSAAHVAGIDPELIRSLEAQVAGLSAHLSQPGVPLPVFDDIGPRIERIERSLAGNRDAVMDAARLAAENAVRGLEPASTDSAAVVGLAQDLKTLESLTRRSDERNTKTFEAIHDTLLKIVDRLGSLDTEATDEEQPAAAKITVQDAPTLQMDEPLSLVVQPDDRATMRATQARTPAEAAMDAARAAMGSESVSESPQPSRRKSMLGGLTRAFSRKEPEMTAPTVDAPVAEVPDVDLDQPLEPKAINRPLEPGSGAPDLNAIMRRVSDERARPAKAATGASAASADFIAAARRHAQAAAAEAEVLKKQAKVDGPVKALRIGDLLKARRKPILMGAIAILLALEGLQLGKAFLSDPTQVAADVPVTVSTKNVEIASAAGGPTADVPATPVKTNPVRMVDAPADGQVKDDTVAEAAPAPEATAVAAAPQPKSPNAGPPVTAMTAAPPAMAMAAPVSTATAAPAPMVPETAEQAKPTEPQTTAAVTAGSETAKIDVPATIGPQALRDAASSGDAKAMFEIGSRYADGRDTKQDMAMAAKWYERAAETGLAPAEYRIGNFYEKGIGVARDIGKAKTWYQLAAEQGNASAMHNLAVLFAMSADGVTDNDSAVHWFQQAAELGVKDSQYNLGIMAAKGVGMKQDLEDSYKWFALVAKTGDKDAAAKRDEIANAMRPEQLAHAKATTDLWKPKAVVAAANVVDIPDAWQDQPTTTASVDMKKAVQNIQRILAKNGYDVGGTDGVMGDKTKKAIMTFQSDNGMKATGEVDETLVKALLARK